MVEHLPAHWLVAVHVPNIAHLIWNIFIYVHITVIYYHGFEDLPLAGVDPPGDPDSGDVLAQDRGSHHHLEKENK